MITNEGLDINSQFTQNNEVLGFWIQNRYIKNNCSVLMWLPFTWAMYMSNSNFTSTLQLGDEAQL